MVGKRKKALKAKVKTKATVGGKSSHRMSKEERRAHKLERRKQEKRNYTAEMWAAPAPSHLVAKLDLPKVKSKHQSYFEFAENSEKKQKKLEFQVTNGPPPPGYMFVPIGDPVLTNACKELSRERDAMIFIVSAHNLKEENSKISEHVHRTGYYFRESIVEEARDIIGETVISNPTILPGTVEPIPESQDEINKQADAAIRDLFPRIPNPDRVMIIEHAFKKGALFHGEPTVGLQANIPLSRRVQLAVLAHIRHTHTRYDKLLRETTWMNARKAVEPVCLDILIKWRGDEETGRDQMDEILREVVIITDSEDEDDSSDEDSSEEEGELTSDSSTEPPSQPNSRNQRRPSPNQARPKTVNTPGPLADRTNAGAISSRTRAKDPRQKEQRGFRRYQAAWEDALNRRQTPHIHTGSLFEHSEIRRPLSVVTPAASSSRQSLGGASRQESAFSQYMPTGSLRSEVIVPHTERSMYYQDVPQRLENSRTVVYQNVPQHSGIAGNSSFPTLGNQPPQVVRRSPLKHGLQDLLVPSIETTSSDVSSPRKDEWNGPGVRDGSNYPRVVGHRTQTPLSRQVIVIDDDSPQVKRRRLVHEDDSGHLRPLLSHDHSVYAPTSHSDSLTLKSSSSVQSGGYNPNSVVRPPRALTQSTQGLSRDTQSYYTDPATGERLPIYDAPVSGHFEPHPGYLRRGDGGSIAVQREDDFNMRSVAHTQPPHDNLYHRRPINMHPSSETSEINLRGHFRQVESQTQMRQKSPGFPASYQPSRAYESDPTSGGPDQDFIHTFSQSRLDGPLSHSRDGFNVVPARSQQSVVSKGSLPYHQNSSARSFASAPSGRGRSPIGHMERPLQHREPLHHQPVYYDQNRPVYPDPQIPTDGLARHVQEGQTGYSGEAPTYVRTIPARRPIIYLG